MPFVILLYSNNRFSLFILAKAYSTYISEKTILTRNIAPKLVLLFFTGSSGQQFKKSLYNPLDVVATNAIANQRRSERYVDFDQMEYMPEIDSALDIYADEMTTSNDYEKLLKVDCLNQEIKIIL